MRAMYYWAVRPIATRDTGENTRIERAATAREACIKAFGRGISPNTWEAKNLGTRVAVIQSNNKRIALLRDYSGWTVIPSDY